ncbi:MAG: GNAT family N-acetyltransferase [Candidatus Kapabacteria bacterium]|nr:GNAT family N-acetyltransferase [Candidatus Kapabacteria bacterium]
MRIIKTQSYSDLEKIISRKEFINFLYEHLDKFGDSKDAISKCLDFAFGINGGLGGFALAYLDDSSKLIGALIMNHTGMSGYIPENILVYVAVHESTRGKGVGREIIEYAIAEAEGDLKLHVEYENPAKRLYERIGFSTKYAEMRFKK